MNNADRSSKTEMAFKLFDMNKDGFITREEFKKVVLYETGNFDDNKLLFGWSSILVLYGHCGFFSCFSHKKH